MNSKRTSLGGSNKKNVIYNLGNTNAFYQTHYRSLGFNSKYCPINEVLSKENVLSELTKEAICDFCTGAREAMRQNNFDRPCCK